MLMRDNSININGRLISFSVPRVMGIVNVTPDSFYSASRTSPSQLLSKVEGMIEDGVDIIDIGGYSTRPGAEYVSAEEEISRLAPAVKEVKRVFPEIPVSIDTFRAQVAQEMVNLGADIINDIGGGLLDQSMYETIARLRVPYILMHTRSTPSDMQQHTDYDNVVADVLRSLAFKISELRKMGVCDIIADPGFGFAKTTEQNFELLATLSIFKQLNVPLLAGLSRKSMIYRTLDISPEQALTGTIALNMAALINGADILRVHDVKEAVQTVQLFTHIKANAHHINQIDDTIRR